MVHTKELLPRGQTINSAYYVNVMERVRKRVIRERKDIAVIWVPHHDNASSHTSVYPSVFSKGQRCNVAATTSPNLTTTYFFSFLRIKNTLKGRHFHNIQAVTTALSEIPIETFERACRAWVSR